MSKQKKNKDTLNEFEINFLNIWFNNGFNATEAYLLAKPGVQYNTAKTEGNKLLTKPYIELEIIKRKLAIQSKSEIKLEDMVSKLKNLMYECIEDSDRTNLLKTIDTLNKMAGFYQQKIDITTQGEKIKINLNLGEDDSNE